MNTHRLFSSLTLLALLPLAAAAHEGEGKNGGLAACREDQKKFCGEVEPGGGRIIACMNEHEKELSEGCRAVMARKNENEGKRKKNHADFAACEADQKKLCAGVKPGEGRIIDCMAAHSADLSGACRELVQKKKDEMQRWKDEKKAKDDGRKDGGKDGGKDGEKPKNEKGG